MFGLITRAEHERILAERLKSRSSVSEKIFRANMKLATRNAALETENENLRARLAKTHTTRGPNGRYVKAEVQA